MRDGLAGMLTAKETSVVIQKTIDFHFHGKTDDETESQGDTHVCNAGDGFF